MRRIPRIVPWTNYQEYEQVYEWLYSNIDSETEKVVKGIERVNAWTSRGKVPRAVESTGALIQVSLRDHHGVAGQLLSQQDLRLMYSMAIIRFVNAMIDPEQKKTYARSMFDIATHLGLPSWFVDLRHGATHEHLPSLATLRSGCRQALNWLNDYYWQASLRPEGLSILDSKTVHTIQTLFDHYKDARKQHIKKLKTHHKADSAPYELALSNLVDSLSSDLIREGVIPIMLDIGGIVPTGKKKRATLDDMSLSEDLVQLWTPLVRKLSSTFSGFGNDLIASMVERIDIRNDYILDSSVLNPMPSFLQTTQTAADEPLKTPSYLLTITCWLIHFVNEYGKQSQSRTFEEVVLDDILEICLRKPNVYTRKVLQAIVAIDEDSTSLKPFLSYIDQLLSKAKQHSSSSAEMDLATELRELEAQVTHLKYNTSANVTNETRSQSGEASSWQLYDSISWSSCPIGCLPNGKVPCLDLTAFPPLEPMDESG